MIVNKDLIEFYEEGQQDIMTRYDIYNEHREKVKIKNYE